MPDFQSKHVSRKNSMLVLAGKTGARLFFPYSTNIEATIRVQMAERLGSVFTFADTGSDIMLNPRWRRTGVGVHGKGVGACIA